MIYPEATLIRTLLRYDQETGHLYWTASGRGRKCGSPAGTANAAGYLLVCINGRSYRAHRLAWIYMTGSEPPREATDAENQQNRPLQANNTSGLIGVSYVARLRKWRAEISCNRSRKNLGCFSSPELAHQAYLRAKAELHTFHPVPRT